MKITVIGCGNGAFATAADLGARGNDITLYADASHERSLRPVMEAGAIEACGVGPEGRIEVRKVTCSEEEAFAGPDLIIISVPATAHEDIAERIGPYLRDGQKILLSPGGTGGALVMAKALRSTSKAKDLRIGEFHTLPYTARKEGPAGIRILLMVRFLMFAAFPAKYNREMAAVVGELYPDMTVVSDVLETSFNNGNATTHPAPVVLNAGKIEYYGKHSHYAEGVTPSVGKVIQIIDDERKAICRSLGYEEIDIKDRLYRMGYCPLRATVYEAIQASTDVFLPVGGPDRLDNRYLTEDTPVALVAMSSLAALTGVETPVMDAVITLASGLMSEDYRKNGRTLSRMGIEGLNAVRLKRFLRTGKR